MPIFHFDIADGVRLEDTLGLVCKSEHGAKETADLIARQIAIDLDADGEQQDGRLSRSQVPVAGFCGTGLPEIPALKSSF